LSSRDCDDGLCDDDALCDDARREALVAPLSSADL
jgi:hypothetical protein